MTEIQMLRSSERKSFKTCPQQWYWGYVEWLRQAGMESMPLWFGTGMHLVWAEYYIPGFTRGRDPHATWDEYCEGMDYQTIKITDDGDAHEVFVNAIELGHAMIDGYLAEYGDEPWMEVIRSEQRIRAILPHPKDPTRPFVDLRGTMDCTVRDHRENENKGGVIKLMDHKHMARIFTAHLAMDEQLAGYTTVSTISLRKDGLIGPKETVAGIWYNILRKAKADERPRDPQGRYRNKPIKKHYIEAIMAATEYSIDPEDKADHFRELSKMTLPKLQVEAEGLGPIYGEISALQGSPRFAREWVPFGTRRRQRQVIRIGEDMVIMNAVRNGKLPIMKSPGDHCSWCPYMELCQLDEDGGDTEDFKKMIFNKEDPYADHREGAENSKATVLLKRKTGVG